MRIAIGGFAHETNQYVSRPTEVGDFTVSRGDEVFARNSGRTYIGGMVSAADDAGLEVIGTLHANAPPSGTISATAYQDLRRELLESLSAVLPVDAVALDLHGAGVAQGADDLEGDVCRAVRELIGLDVPLVVTHDLHGNITPAEATYVDAMFGVHHYPHDDMYDRGREAVQSIPRIISGEWRPTTHVERLPMLLPTSTTYHGPGRRAYEICQDLELRPGVLDCTFMHGFPYTDNQHVGSTVVAITNDDAALAEAVAKEAAEAIWAFRDDFIVRHRQPAEAVRQALTAERFPVVINETSDNAGGGSPCDGTHLLRALLDARPEGAVFVGIRDPQVVAQATAVGVGGTIDIDLGGQTDDLHGAPIRCRAYVKALTDGHTLLEAQTGRGLAYPLGRSARLVIDGVDVIVISNGVQTIDRTPLILHGIDPLDCKLIALKSSNHFRSGFQDLAAAIITTDPPGLTTTQLDQLPKTRTPRPIFPLDENVTYP